MFSLDISSTGASAMGVACRSQSSESGGGSSGNLAAEGCKSRMLSYLKKLKKIQRTVRLRKYKKICCVDKTLGKGDV